MGIGKPAVFAMSAYGQAGIEKMLQVLKEELVKCMQLCGVTSLDQLCPAHVNYTDLAHHTTRTIIPPSPYDPRLASNSNTGVNNAVPKTAPQLRAEIAALEAQVSELCRRLCV